MSRRRRWIAVIVGWAAAIVALGVLALYLAVRHEPAFYRRAMAIEPAVLDKASDQMLQQIAALKAHCPTRAMEGRHHGRADQRLAGGRSGQEPSEHLAAVGP